MSPDPAAVLLGALGCGAAGLLVPALVRRIPDPAPDPEHPTAPYAAVAGRPGLAIRAAALAAVAGGLVGGAVGLAWPLLYLLPLVPVAVALAVVDLHTRLLPTVVVWPTLAAVVLLGALSALLEQDPQALVRALVGTAGVGAFFYALWRIHPAGMGFGDVRLSTVVGFALAYLGYPEVLLGVYAGFLAFALPGLVVAVVRRDRGVLSAAYPFGPFLLGGALVGVVLADPVWGHLAQG